MPSAYFQFLADPQRIDLWLAEIYLDAGTLRVATGEYATDPTDSPANTPYGARLKEGPNFNTDSAPPGTLGNLPDRRGGELVLLQRFGDLDSYKGVSWDGKRIVVRHGGYSPRLARKLTYAEMGTAEYESEQALFGLDEVTVQLRDPVRRFEDPLQARRYMGTDFTLAITGATTFVDFGAAAKCNLTGDLTIEARIWIDTLATAIRFFVWDGASAYPFDVLINTTGTIRFYASNYSGTLTTTAALATKRWYHFQITRAGTAITFNILEEAPGTETTEVLTASAATGASNVGGTLRHGASANPFRGIIDSLRLWNYARTADEWRDQRGRELTATESALSTLKLACRFNDATGATVADSSSSPANGTIGGANFVWLPSLQGKADLASKVLPDGFGLVEDANPVLVYEPTRIYQIHSRQVNSITDASEGGASITLNTAYTDWLAFLTATVTADAKYDSLNCTDGTFVRWRSKPSKPISVTFRGDASGSGYVSTAADIWRRVICTRGTSPLVDPTDLDGSSFSNLNTANSAVVGIYVTGEMTIEEFGKRVLGSMGAVGFFRRVDRTYRVLLFKGSTTGDLSPSVILSLTEKQILSIAPAPIEQPVREVILAYRHNYSPMTLDQMASGTIDTARQAFLEKPTRDVQRSKSATKTAHKYSRVETLETYLTTEADAIAEADRRLALFSGEPQAYQVEATAVGFEFDRMDPIFLTVQDINASGVEQVRLGLNALQFIILAVGERSAEGRRSLTVWRESA
jgi:hypothetical protein